MSHLFFKGDPEQAYCSLLLLSILKLIITIERLHSVSHNLQRLSNALSCVFSKDLVVQGSWCDNHSTHIETESEVVSSLRSVVY